MKFDHPESVEQIVWQCKLADYPRGQNRAKINSLLDGFPPYSSDEARTSQIETNVNFPENGANVAHNARRQLDNALLLPDPLFSVEVDYGPQWQKQKWSNIITKELNKIIKASASYDEMQKSVNSLNVSHGIGPTVWRDKHSWEPVCRGMEDVLVPSNTLLGLSNLPFFAVYEQYTAFELWRLTHGPRVDPGWNLDLVEKAIRWVDQQTMTLMSASWPEVWSPEKMEDRIKQDGGLYSSDAVPTIDTWHFYWWDDDRRQSGWRKKIILDAWGEPGVGGAGGIMPTTGSPSTSRVPGKYNMDGSYFLYDSRGRKFADKISQLIHLQVANCSSKAPFHYHSVRSLGFLLYAVCNLQNRLRCRFNDSVFESLIQYFRVTNQTDAERALKVNFMDKLPLPESIQFVTPDQRWKVDERLMEMAMQVNRQSITDSSASYAQDFDFESGQNETATRTMAKVNANAAMVSGMTNQAYQGKKFQYMEICRRFCIPNSKDPDVRKFRVNVLKQGVPEGVLNSECWNVMPTKVLGGGNRMVQMGMTERIMQVYTKLDPNAQKEALRLFLAYATDDFDLAQRWVPETKQISDSVHDAQLSAGVMLAGGQLGLRQGVNHQEYVEAMLVAMAAKVAEINQRGGVATPQELSGLQNIAGQTIQGQPLQNNGILAHLEIYAEDTKQPHRRGQQPDNSVKQKVKEYADALKGLMNQVKAFAQRMQEQQQKQAQAQNGGSQLDPKDAAKIQAITLMAQTKAQLGAQSHAMKTAQRQLSFEQKMRQDQQTHELELAQDASEIQNNRLRSFQE